MTKTLQKMLALLLFAAPGWAATDFVPPPPEQVFSYEVEATKDQVLINWNVGEGYYLYKHRFSFRSLTPNLTLDQPLFPEGEIHSDEFFGEQEIFRGRFTIAIPYSHTGASSSADIELTLQGCADIGFCYMPVTWQIGVQLPSTPEPANRLQALLGRNGSQAFLPEQEAFQLATWVEGDFTVVARWLIADGYYLYRDKFTARSDSRIAQPGPLDLPTGDRKNDLNFGEIEVYHEQVEIRIPLSRASPQPGQFDLDLGYQGCAENAICYPPGTRTQTIDLPPAGTTAGRDPPPRQSETDQLSSLIRNASPIAFVATFFGLGLLLAFTPCVLPMVPILLGIIVGQGKTATSGRAFALSLTYVLGMALTYTVAGAGFAMAGQQAQAVFQKPWIIILLSALFAAMALAMFGFYNLQMPAALQTWASNLSGRQKAGTFVGTALIGALSALIVTACVAPALVSALAVIGQAGDVARGALALFALSLGMGAPLILIGASAGRLLPKAGAWMERVKALFGVMMLGVAVWMLARLVHGPIVLGLWGGVALVAALYFGAFDRAEGKIGPWQLISRIAGWVALVYGAVALIGAFAGGSDPFRPLEGLQVTAEPGSAHRVRFERIKSVADLENSLARAAAENRPALLDFYADWCVSCIEMEKYTFATEEVQDALGNAMLLQADVTANDQTDQELLQKFGIYGPPTIVFFDRDGRELQGFRIVGYKPADQFAAHVREAFDTR